MLWALCLFWWNYLPSRSCPPHGGWFHVKLTLIRCNVFELTFFAFSSLTIPTSTSAFTQQPQLHHPHVSPHPPRLRQPVQPHAPQPVRRVRGPAGPPPAGGAGQVHTHVSVEGGHCAGLAGGCHGNAHVHTHLFGKRQEWQGRIKTPTWCTWTYRVIMFNSTNLTFVLKVTVHVYLQWL